MEALYFFFTLASGFCNEHFPPVCPMAQGLLLHQSLRTRKGSGFSDFSLAHILASQRKRSFIDFLPLVSSHVKFRLLGLRSWKNASILKPLGPAGNPVNATFSPLPNFTSISNVKTRQKRIFLQWYLFNRKYLPNEHCHLLGDSVVNKRERSHYPKTRSSKLEAQSLASATVTPSSPPCSLLGMVAYQGDSLPRIDHSLSKFRIHGMFCC